MRRFRATTVRHALPLCAALLFAACKGIGDMTAPKPVETPVASVVLSSTQVTLAEGASVALQATARDEDNRPLTDRSSFWSSSDTAVARVSAAGVVSAIRAGSAQIAVSIDGRSAVAQLTPRLWKEHFAAQPLRSVIDRVNHADS